MRATTVLADVTARCASRAHRGATSASASACATTWRRIAQSRAASTSACAPASCIDASSTTFAIDNDDAFDAHAPSTDARTLEQWLRQRGVDPGAFASGRGCKDVEDLLSECRAGESALAGARDERNPDLSARRAIRTVRVVTIRIRRPEYADDDPRCLIEISQTFANGKTRSRMRPLSEKLAAGELWRDGVARAVREELGSTARDGHPLTVHVIDRTYAHAVSERESTSYPGLTSRFDLHRVDAVVRGLPPDDEFESVERTARGDLRARWAFLPFVWPDEDIGPG